MQVQTCYLHVAFLGGISIAQPLVLVPAMAGCGLAKTRKQSCVCRAGLAVKRGDGCISCSQVSTSVGPPSISRVWKEGICMHQL